MQNEFDDWSEDNCGTSSGQRIGCGGWHWLLSVLAVLIVSALSFLMAYWTREVPERPVWMMGLIFMVPTAALMLAVVLVEGATSAMTPGTSRKPQIILAVIATIATFIVGCICDLIYLEGFRKPPMMAHSEYQRYEVSDRLILAADQTVSMAENGAGEEMNRAVSRLLDSGLEGEVGFVSETCLIDASVITPEQRETILSAAGRGFEQGRMYYVELLEKALTLSADGETRTRVILFTDGLHLWSRDGGTDLTEAFLSRNVSLYCIVPDGAVIDPKLTELVRQTGGRILNTQQIDNMILDMKHIRYDETVTPPEVQAEQQLLQDLVRNNDHSSRVITFIMLLLEGLSLGICLSLMMSTARQFRAQYILSPLMGIVAFVLLKIVWGSENLSTWWIREGICFSLFGFVFMRKNLFSHRGGNMTHKEDDLNPDF